MIRGLAAFALVLSLAGAGRAQSLSEAATVSLITVLPGDQIHARFGHSAIRVTDPERGFDWLYNYGTFNFDGTFVFKFAYGKLDYLLSVVEYDRALYVYANYEERSVVEQKLNLTARQREALFGFLEWNALPENRTYRYDFLFDNCSTRERDALERALGPDLRYPALPDTSPTFRALLAPYLADAPALHAGIDLLLGLPVDRPATPREATFLPDHLFTLFAHAEVLADTGWVPLVADTDTVVWLGEERGRAIPWLTFLTLLLLLAGLWLTWREWRSGLPDSYTGWFDASLFGIVGLAGVVVAFLWFVSLHDVTGPNLNLLWAWPTHLAFAIVLLRRNRPHWLRSYALVTALVTLATVLLWFALPQALPVALLPVALLAGIRALMWARRNRDGALRASGRKTVL